ncbi:MAG TPA: nucleoside hydrolase [Acidimicrobiia bacterium]|nr:nucleoside hydrolase [Acidimicrobiia bacterium]
MKAGRPVVRAGAFSSRSGLAAATFLFLLVALLYGCGDDASQSVGVSAPATTRAAPPSGIPLVIDTDLAVDSVMALLYLLGRPEVEIAAITVSGTGEVRCGPGAEIAAGLVALAGVEGVSVACGPGEPLSGFNAFPADWRSAADEAWGLDLPAGEAPSELSAPDLLVSVVSSSEEPLVVFTDGPLTNVAAALRRDPGIAKRITMLYVMGGAIDVSGNTPINPDAEYNIWVDPTAAAEVFASGVPITLVALDATNQVPLEARHVRALQQHAAAPAAAAALTMLQPDAIEGLYFWDQLAAAILVDESLAEFETMTLTVTTDGDPSVVGVTRRAAQGSEVRVAVAVDATRFEHEFLSSLAGKDVGPVAVLSKRPAVTVEDLLASLIAAADGGDSDAWASLSTEGAVISTYQVIEGEGRLIGSSPMAEWNPEADPMHGIDAPGEPLVIGDAAATSVRYSPPDESMGDAEGFLVIVGNRAKDGLLVEGGARLFGINEPPTDALAAQQLMEAYVAAWNDDDVEGVLATMAHDGVLWGNVLYPETMDSVPALREMLAGAFWLQLETTGPLMTSGSFAAVPLRFVDETSGGSLGVIAVFWIRDGRIALMVIAEGELQG